MKSRLIRLSEIIIPIDVTRLDNGDYLATSKSLSELTAQGRTIAEAMEIAQDVARKLIESHVEHGDPLPSTIRRQIKKQAKKSQLQIPVAVSV